MTGGGPAPKLRLLEAEAGPQKSRAAALSICSNSALIVLKLVAGALTGSIAIITEAVHSSVDLLASVVAFFSVRKADEPADASHPYGHEKVENLSAALEGVLILLGAGHGWGSPAARDVGWAFTIWGFGLYWWAALLYLAQVRQLTSSAGRRLPGTGAASA